MPATRSLTLTLPSQLGDAQQFRAEMRAQVAAVESAVAADRLRTGGPVLGRRAIFHQSA